MPPCYTHKITCRPPIHPLSGSALRSYHAKCCEFSKLGSCSSAEEGGIRMLVGLMVERTWLGLEVCLWAVAPVGGWIK